MQALKSWCHEAGIETGPIFRRFTRSEDLLSDAITSQSVNLILKNLAAQCNLQKAGKYSGHSLRRGFATEASKQGAFFPSIKKQGRWQSDKTVLGYFEEGQGFQDNAVSVLLVAEV